jgi:putative hemolysin
MKDKIKAAYQDVHGLWASSVVDDLPMALQEVLGKAVQALRDAALIAGQPGLHQTNCVMSGGIVHAVKQRDGKPRCGIDLPLDASLDTSVRVPTCITCMEILINESQAKA